MNFNKHVFILVIITFIVYGMIAFGTYYIMYYLTSIEITEYWESNEKYKAMIEQK